MPLQTPGTIERLRRVNRTTLKDAATIERSSVVSGPGGANAGGQAFAVVGGTDATPLDCRMSPLGAGAIAEADQPTNLDRWLIAFDLGGPDILAGDRVTVTGQAADGDAYTRRLIVISAQAPRTTSAMRLYVAEDAGPGRR